MHWTKTELTFRFVNRADVSKFPMLQNPPDSIPENLDLNKFGPLVSRFDFSHGSACSDGDIYFGPQQYVINTTFCGDWAGATWGQYPECKAKGNSCTNYVSNNPNDFVHAYWKIGYIAVYNAELYDQTPDILAEEIDGQENFIE